MQLLFVISITETFAQKNTEDTSAKFKIVAAGPQYKRSKRHDYFWGTNYRKIWAIPVKVPVLLLPDVKGGLTVTREDGGHQATSLHVETTDGKQYTLRSVDKKLATVSPEIFLGTWIEKQVNDEVSMSNPYAAVTIPEMAQYAGIYHTNPQVVYLPKQDALDSFNNELGNKMYLFEQRPKGDWSNADNLGNFKKFYSTEDVIKEIEEETENVVDQKAFVRARLFDMFIGDWDRHEDQWKWGKKEKGNKNIFEPVPVDRGQAYFKHNGLILDAAISASGIRYFQSFDKRIKDVRTLNYEERGIDRLFTNELTKEDWIHIAKELQDSLTDSVIENSLKKLPPEVYAISGKRIAGDLEVRRNSLVQYAVEYYLFLSKRVEILGSEGPDYFLIKKLSDSATRVSIFNHGKDRTKADSAYYSRTFFKSETCEIRIYGLSGKDVYNSQGDAINGITIRIIGGFDKDSISIDKENKEKIYVYDGHDDYISGSNIKRHLSGDSAIHEYEYKNYMYDLRGTSGRFFYSDEDRFYIGFGYIWKHYSWRKSPFAFVQNISANYSISQNAMSFNYFGIFPNTVGKWNLSLLANYDFIRWTNFYGPGNETILATKDLNYNRMRTRELTGEASLYRTVGNNFFRITGTYKRIKIIDDPDRYIAKTIAPLDPGAFEAKNFATLSAVYGFSKLNDKIVPTSGINFSANGSFTQNINKTSQSFWKYGSTLQLYVPLVTKFSLALSGGIETVDGNPEFYQYPEIGGGPDLRGFQKQRFYGKTAFYNSNELRFITNVRNYFYNGKAGLLAFVDDGRVWNPGEKSSVLHTGYGVGILVAPFNFIFAEATYGFSNEDQLIQLRLNVTL
ncbi:MAG: BamA/TamA family outer membrane protein [Bacteroidota bacterium]|nr:BamA/TamA family outer membrane protein [Bacteroidota bacterium]